MTPGQIHRFVEHHAAALIFGILFVAMLGGMAQIIPSLFDKNLSTPSPTLTQYTPLQLAGREVYLRESCALCHTQQIRPLVAEIRRYGIYSTPGEFVYDRPFLWGSKRTGPDLHRIGGKYSDVWHRLHLLKPRAVVPASIMPAYPWLDNTQVDVDSITRLMSALRRFNVDYSDEEIEAAKTTLADKTEMEALIAYLQSLGVGKPANTPVSEMTVGAH